MVVGALIFDPSQVNVYVLLETVVSMTPQGIPEGTLVAMYEECENDVPVPVIVPVFVAVPVIEPVLVPVAEAVFGLGRAVDVPSTWICPAVALVGIAMVCPEEVSGGLPGVRVTVPATRLVGLPVSGTPSIVYVDSGLLVAVLFCIIVPEAELAPEALLVPEAVFVPEADFVIEAVFVPEVEFVPEAVLLPDAVLLPEAVFVPEAVPLLEPAPPPPPRELLPVGAEQSKLVVGGVVVHPHGWVAGEGMIA